MTELLQPAPASPGRFFSRIRRRVLVAMVPALLAGACNDRDSNFSQYPGFAEWYAANPPAERLPTDDEQTLLRRYQPRFYLPAGSEGPIDFYRDYIAKGRLKDGDGALISDMPTQEMLNAGKADPTLVFTHVSDGAPPSPTVYGRIGEETVRWPGCAEPVALAFLTYHLVFRSSGLPAGVPAWQAWPLRLIADLDDWHQLDHYTAVTLTLAPLQPDTLQLIAATFQQHNYQRTYLIGERTAPGRMALSTDGRVEVDIAIRSNELYPHTPGRTSRRAVSFMDIESAAYLVADGEAPWLAADDVTDPAIELDPPLSFLRPNDAFYTFQGWLGERRRLPGRDGPPGADYNTLPPMKPLVHQMAVSYWHEGDRDWLEHYNELRKNGRPERIDPAPFLARIADKIDLAC